jgi:hypothetical protein
MDWMLLTELSSMFCGPWHGAAVSVDAGGAAEAGKAVDAVETVEAVEAVEAPMAAELWIAQQSYAFMAARTVCERCGARLSRKVSAARHPEAGGITVGARCRGWRHHQYTALVSRGRDGLRFGTLEPS